MPFEWTDEVMNELWSKRKKVSDQKHIVNGASPVFLYTDQTNDCNRIYPSGWFWFPTLCRLVRWLFDQVFLRKNEKKIKQQLVVKEVSPTD